MSRYIDIVKYEYELRLKTAEIEKTIAPNRDYESGYLAGLTYARWLLEEMPTVDAKERQKAYQHDYYMRVAKPKRQAAKMDGGNEE